MGKSEHRVDVDGGKYTFVIPADDYRVSILRHGKPWHGPQAEACKALHSIMCELDAARVVVAETRRTLEYSIEGMAPYRGIREAIDLHDRLVGTQTGPSEWCK